MLAALSAAAAADTAAARRGAPSRFEGKYYRGAGDVDYLRLFEVARRMFEPDPELQNLTMLYEPKWNGLVEGPTWDAWWIQNSYGTTYGILPFLHEPFVTFLQNSQDLWFDQMGDGRRVGAPPPHDWVAPDGCLCDAARPGWIVYKQGDGRIAIHDWGMEFTAAGLLLQSELLLISRDARALAHYLPKLERCAAFIETRRDPTNHLFLAGPAGNLLAPSYAGWRRPDGTYDKAYLTGLSITYIAALDRLIEVEKLAGRPERAAGYAERRDAARRALPRLTTEEGYFIRSLDPDGVKHGVYGAARHGYFEAPPNHDAIAFRVVDDVQAARIFARIAALPQLRPHDFILPNYPSYDDMYEKPEGLWAYGTWVNGGHWSTCEARMMLGYLRLGAFEDARRSMRRLLDFARRWRMDNPLTQCGSDVYQPHEPINLCYDTFGPAAGFLRGAFEYLYSAAGLRLIPHLPPAVTEFEQLDPVRFGDKRVYLTVAGHGPIRRVTVNGRRWKDCDAEAVFLPYERTPAVARVVILRGTAPAPRAERPRPAPGVPVPIARRSPDAAIAALEQQAVRLRDFERRLQAAGLGESYEAAHARLAVACVDTLKARRALQQLGRISRLPPVSQKAAEQAFVDTARKLCTGLEQQMQTRGGAPDPRSRKLWEAWRASAPRPGARPRRGAQRDSGNSGLAFSRAGSGK